MSERTIKLLGIVLVFLINLASGWIFESGTSLQIVLRIGALLIFMIFQWEAAHFMIRFGRRKFPQLIQVRKRVKFTAVYFFCISVLIQILNDIAIDVLIDVSSLTIDLWRIATLILNALLFSLTTIGMFEAVYYYSNFSRSEVEKQELLRANLQTQLDSLKGQVSPHFLFNSLNTLSALIPKDSRRAELFVQELSNVYRYLLRSNEQEVVSLVEELDFADSYIHLLTTRFGSNFRVEKSLNPHYHSYFLPPLTLQLLIENAVKHNIVSSKAPLQIRIFTEPDHRLYVQNNLQKKQRSVVSSKLGLANISAKYKLLGQLEIEIRETETHFTVILPLINASIYESIYR